MSIRSARSLIVIAVVLGAAWSAGAQETTRDALVARCKADLAARLGVSADGVQVVSVEDVTWPDGSLGCPQPGMDYTMALVDGHRIVLEAAGKTHEYHTDRSQRLLYCEQPAAAVEDREGPGPRPTGQETPIGPEPARPVVLALEAVPGEPNGNSRLVARYLPPDERPAETVLEQCTDFAVAEEGLILAKRRTSRSGHELLLVRQGQEPVSVMKAFDFEALAFIPASGSYFFLVRESAGSAFRAFGGDARRPPVALEWAPEVQRGYGAVVAFGQGVLVLSVPGADEGPEREVIVLDLNAGKVLAEFRSAKAVPSLALADG